MHKIKSIIALFEELYYSESQKKLALGKQDNFWTYEHTEVC